MANILPPVPLQDIQDFPYSIQDWFRKVQLYFGTAGTIPWASVDKTGSALSDLVTRNHNSLQNVQGGAANDYYHFTNTQHTDLIDFIVPNLSGSDPASPRVGQMWLRTDL